MDQPAINTDNMTVGRPIEGGAVWTSFEDAPKLPTDASTDMSTLTGWESCGELSDDGYKDGLDTKSTSYKGWSGSTVLTTIDETTQTYQMAFLEVDRGTVAKLKYGKGNVTLDTDGTWKQIDQKAVLPDVVVPLVIDELESNGHKVRTVVHKAKITKVDDSDHKNGSLVTVSVTFTALDPGSGENAVSHYRAVPAASPAEAAE